MANDSEQNSSSFYFPFFNQIKVLVVGGIKSHSNEIFGDTMNDI